jgi:hypothetical protein
MAKIRSVVQGQQTCLPNASRNTHGNAADHSVCGREPLINMCLPLASSTPEVCDGCRS